MGAQIKRYFRENQQQKARYPAKKPVFRIVVLKSADRAMAMPKQLHIMLEKYQCRLAALIKR